MIMMIMKVVDGMPINYKKLVLSVYPEANIVRTSNDYLNLYSINNTYSVWFGPTNKLIYWFDVLLHNKTQKEYEDYLWKAAWEKISKEIQEKLEL